MIKPIGVKLDDKLHTRLKNLSERCDRSPHWLMKKAISEYVDRMEEEENERKLLIGRWNDYQETGESISHESVVNWLESWGTDKESSCPTNQN
ncbi:MAG: ribbon-helix-helix protein, CopG family [Methylococcaceae bacterium]|nr:ribbon-helix-helix protein, CopG family [Methylococcaceae bacterium]